MGVGLTHKCVFVVVSEKKTLDVITISDPLPSQWIVPTTDQMCDQQQQLVLVNTPVHSASS